MRSKAVHLLALFVIVYIGVEVTVGGIIFVIYMIVTSSDVPARLGLKAAGKARHFSASAFEI